MLNFFVILVVDRGFTFLPPNMSTDHLVTLERFCEEEGALVLAPRGKNPEWILQLNGNVLKYIFTPAWTNAYFSFLEETGLLEKTSTEDMEGKESRILNEKKIVTLFRKAIECQFSSEWMIEKYSISLPNCAHKCFDNQLIICQNVLTNVW